MPAYAIVLDYRADIGEGFNTTLALNYYVIIIGAVVFTT
jgi:hypothetical protein